jgi:glycosyltransferase involved in cell wall biosynthesis
MCVIGMKCLNEAKAVQRCIGDFHDEPFCDKVIVIDGGSSDYTLQELKKFPKVQVFVHPWLDDYHYQEVIQSNILLSYIPQGEIMMIMDFDERMSPALKSFLNDLDPSTMPEQSCVHFSRVTYELMRYENSPYAMMEDDGWPMISHKIGQYPDYQCRLIRKHYAMHWINSPHHQLLGALSNKNVDANIIHYEKDDVRDRVAIEMKWARAQARRIELGIPPDIFESNVKHPEIGEYYDPEGWK